MTRPPAPGFTRSYLGEVAQILQQLDGAIIDKAVGMLAEVRDRGGRLFILGVGGGAANAAHAVNDFRKLAELEAYSPTDNVAELTARINDEGWPGSFEAWLRVSRIGANDLILVFSVGGGDLARNISPNLVRALEYARTIGVRILGIVGREAGFTAGVADACIVVPCVNRQHVTPHTEACQAVLWHLMVSHPRLKRAPTKWESTA